MQPLRDLLDRIQWDAEFARGNFSIGYYDRILRQEQIVPFTAISLEPPETFALQDADGVIHHIPLHRVRAVYKDGVIIWSRPARPAGD